MEIAIIGLPDGGQDDPIYHSHRVHEATRVGLMEARVGITKVPDARPQRWLRSS